MCDITCEVRIRIIGYNWELYDTAGLFLKAVELAREDAVRGVSLQNEASSCTQRVVRKKQMSPYRVEAYDYVTEEIQKSDEPGHCGEEIGVEVCIPIHLGAGFSFDDVADVIGNAIEEMPDWGNDNPCTGVVIRYHKKILTRTNARS